MIMRKDVNNRDEEYTNDDVVKVSIYHHIS